MAPARYDRNAIARSLGFRNYYELRIRGGIEAARRGAVTPETPRPAGEELRRARGHVGLSDLVREIQPESLIMISTNLRNLDRDDAGNWEAIPLTVYAPDGDEREYLLRDMSDDDIAWLIGELEGVDVDYSPDYNLGALIPAGYA